MATDPLVRDLKFLLISRYRYLGKLGLDPRTLINGALPAKTCFISSLTHYQDQRTGTHFYVMIVGIERELRFFIKKQELETG